MVKFFSTSTASTHSGAIGEAVVRAIGLAAPQLHELRMRVDVELDPNLSEEKCDSDVTWIVGRLLQQAISRSLMDGELQISVCQTMRGVEIEIADGSQFDSFPVNAFSRCRSRWWSDCGEDQRSFESLRGMQIFHTRCPQGGNAWTIVLAPKRVLQRAVA